MGRSDVGIDYSSLLERLLKGERMSISTCIWEEGCRVPWAKAWGDTSCPRKVPGFNSPPQEMTSRHSFLEDRAHTECFQGCQGCYIQCRRVASELSLRWGVQCLNSTACWLSTLWRELKCLYFNWGRFGFSVSRWERQKAEIYYRIDFTPKYVFFNNKLICEAMQGKVLASRLKSMQCSLERLQLKGLSCGYCL